MRDLAARSRALARDARRYEKQLVELVRELDRTLLDEPGIGPISAAKLFACDPARFKTRSRLRPLQRNRTDTGILRQDRPLPTQPRWRSPSQQRHPHDRDHPRQTPARDARLPRPPHPRGQDQTRSHARPQTPHLARALQTPRRGPVDFIEASLTPPTAQPARPLARRSSNGPCLTPLRRDAAAPCEAR